MANDGIGPSIQERLYPEVDCFGCGPANAKGLRLRSFADDGFVRAAFLPWPEHGNGLGFLNGGIICTVLDCHSAAAVVLEAERRQILTPDGPSLPFVTAGLDVRYLRPSPLTDKVALRAVVVSSTDDAMEVDVELVWQDKVRAAGTAHWKRWRPR